MKSSKQFQIQSWVLLMISSLSLGWWQHSVAAGIFLVAFTLTIGSIAAALLADD